MTTVVEIEKALQTLPIKEAWKLAGWLQEYLDESWDQQIDDDIAAGRLDKSADKALQDYRDNRVMPFDEIIER